MESIVLGGGCFWCLDASFRLINGVNEVVSGYAGGTTKNPSYEEVASQTTGHAEVVKVTFDTKIIKLNDILDIFWAIHNPTTKDRQGHDVGPEYRSIILYANESQKQIVEASLSEAQKLWENPITTDVKLLEEFYPAEDYHQDFFTKNPEYGYCQVVINPKLAKLREKFEKQLK